MSFPSQCFDREYAKLCDNPWDTYTLDDQLTFNYIFCPIVGICFITVIIALYVFIRHYINSKKNQYPQLFYVGLIFLIITLFAVGGLIGWRLSYYIFSCSYIEYEEDTENNELNTIFMEIGITYLLFYGLQTWLLSITLFCRLYYVFLDSAFSINIKTLKIYIILFCIYPFLSPTASCIWLVSN